MGAPHARKRRPPWSQEAWNRLLVLLIAACALLSSTFGFLHVDAGSHAARADRDARAAMLRAVAKSSAAIVRYGFERERLAAFQSLAAEWLVEREQALAAAEGGAEAEAAARLNAAHRLFRVMDASRVLSTLLCPPYFDEATFAADVVQFNVDYFTAPSVRASEEDEALRAASSAWGAKSGRFVMCLTVTAVSAFLFGLAVSLRGALRRLFAILGGTIGLALVGIALATALATVPTAPSDSIAAYADAAGHVTYAAYIAPLGESDRVNEHAAQAIDLATRAIALRPAYAAAYELRAMARLLSAESSPSPFAGPGYPAAVADFDRAVALGRDSGSLEDLRARALFFSGRPGDAIAAERRALGLSPEKELQFRLHLAILLLGAAREEEARREAEAAFAYAQAHPLGSDSAALREAIGILERLAPLEWPGRQALETRVKEALVSLTYLGTATSPAMSARVSLPVFRDLSDGEPQADFPSGTQAVAMQVDLRDLAAGSLLVVRVVRDGIEQPSLGWSETWTGEADALFDRTIGVLGGTTVFDLAAGTYTVEIFVNAVLAASGTFVVS